jgi:hypothetical protein
MQTRDWAIVSAVTVTIGLICMRGFGSRSSF